MKIENHQFINEGIVLVQEKSSPRPKVTKNRTHKNSVIAGKILSPPKKNSISISYQRKIESIIPSILNLIDIILIQNENNGPSLKIMKSHEKYNYLHKLKVFLDKHKMFSTSI